MRDSNTKRATAKSDKNGLILIAGAGGFIGGVLVRYFHGRGFTPIRAVDKKPLPHWYQRTPGVENLCSDLRLRRLTAPIPPPKAKK
jgi:nucleoside-diphosphate-sugar epimerase